MEERIEMRSATAAEREVLAGFAGGAPGTARRWKEAAENALVLSAVSLLVFVLGWLSLAWLLSTLFHVDVGARSEWALPVLGVGGVACIVAAMWSSVRWLKAWPDDRPRALADAAAGLVTEERHEFTAARRLQDPEHGGLIYLLRRTDGRVWTIYDTESQERSMLGQDPLESGFAVRTNLAVVRAPGTGHVIRRSFDGAVLDAGAPLELTADPASWPEPDACCAIAWEEIESRLCRVAS